MRNPAAPANFTQTFDNVAKWVETGAEVLATSLPALCLHPWVLAVPQLEAACLVAAAAAATVGNLPGPFCAVAGVWMEKTNAAQVTLRPIITVDGTILGDTPIPVSPFGPFPSFTVDVQTNRSCAADVVFHASLSGSGTFSFECTAPVSISGSIRFTFPGSIGTTIPGSVEIQGTETVTRIPGPGCPPTAPIQASVAATGPVSQTPQGAVTFTLPIAPIEQGWSFVGFRGAQMLSGTLRLYLPNNPEVAGEVLMPFVATP